MNNAFFGKDIFQALLGGQPETKPVYKIECSYDDDHHGGGFWFELPYEYVSDVNARAALSVFRELGQDDLQLLLNEHSKRRPQIKQGSVQFGVKMVRA